MRFPLLPVRPVGRLVTDVFGGWSCGPRVGEGEFSYMENLTSDHYPCFGPRRRRGVYQAAGKPQGLIAKDSLCYVDGGNFVMNEYRVDMGLSTAEEDCPKQLVSMGAYVIILPDKKWINTLDTTQFGSMEAAFETSTDVAFSLCSITGEAYKDPAVSPSAPANPENMALWIDTSAAPHTLKQYAESSGMWVSIPTTYVKISAAGIGKAFEQYDGVTLSGITEEGVEGLNGSAVIWDKGDDYIVVVGILDRTTVQLASQGAVRVSREMPYMDHVVEAGNRLWGCRYGVARNGQVVNEIYGSKLGDFKNWNCFMGISTDSWVGSVGTDGPFTGAITHLGYPLFFKETVLHKVYISQNGAHSIQDTACRGVQSGCGDSLAIVNEVLYYAARGTVCAYDGSLPQECSRKLGQISCTRAVGAGFENKYYICLEDPAGQWQLYVYDTLRGLWHREDGLHAASLCPCRGVLYAIDGGSGNIITLSGGGETEGRVKWIAQTGELGLSSPDRKYISRLNIRMQLELGTELLIQAQYVPDGNWETLCGLRGSGLRSFSVPVMPRRSDWLRLRFLGEGDGRIYSITRTVEQGSDRWV